MMRNSPTYKSTACRRLLACAVLAVVTPLVHVACFHRRGDARQKTARQSQPPPQAAQKRAKAPARFYVAPDGTTAGDGSIERPWDLATALAHPPAVAPGDTIWLRGGTYRGCFVSKLTGGEDAPIVVRQYAGERAVIDSNGCGTGRKDRYRFATALTVQGSDTWFWGFEVLNSNPYRKTERAGSNPGDVERGAGMNVRAPRTKLINLVIHDAGDGVGFWRQAVDAEVYGCLIYNNGWVGPDRGHGHGIYIQNETGTKRVTDVISFNNFATGMKAYGVRGPTIGIHFEGVISFNNGSPSYADKRVENIFVGPDGETPAEDIRVVNCYLYHPPGLSGKNLHVGYSARNNRGVRLEGNYVAGSDQPFIMEDWQSGRVAGNTIYAAGSAREQRNFKLANLVPSDGAGTAAFDWNNNTYFDGTGKSDKAFKLSTANLNFEGWRKATGFDSASQYSQGRPTGLKVFIRPNRYEAGRAHVVVYNWEGHKVAEINLGDLLRRGAKYELRNAQDYWAPPVLTGTYDGRPLRVPMSELKVARPVGHDTLPAGTGPEFGAFVLLYQQ